MLTLLDPKKRHPPRKLTLPAIKPQRNVSALPFPSGPLGVRIVDACQVA